MMHVDIQGIENKGLDILRLSGCGGGNENSHRKPSCNQKIIQEQGWIPNQGRQNILTKCPLAHLAWPTSPFPGLNPQARAPGPWSSRQHISYIWAGSVCVSYWLEVKLSHRPHTPMGLLSCTPVPLTWSLVSFHCTDFLGMFSVLVPKFSSGHVHRQGCCHISSGTYVTFWKGYHLKNCVDFTHCVCMKMFCPLLVTTLAMLSPISTCCFFF